MTSSLRVETHFMSLITHMSFKLNFKKIFAPSFKLLNLYDAKTCHKAFLQILVAFHRRSILLESRSHFRLDATFFVNCLSAPTRLPLYSCQYFFAYKRVQTRFKIELCLNATLKNFWIVSERVWRMPYIESRRVSANAIHWQTYTWSTFYRVCQLEVRTGGHIASFNY